MPIVHRAITCTVNVPGFWVAYTTYGNPFLVTLKEPPEKLSWHQLDNKQQVTACASDGGFLFDQVLVPLQLSVRNAIAAHLK